MAFLSGSIGFQRFQVIGSEVQMFGPEQLEILENFSCSKFESSSTETVQVGFLGGSHLFDQTFDLEKNVIHDALHCGIRIDSNQIPSAIRKAWQQMELAAITAEHPERRPTKAERQEAKDAVEARCTAEAATGKYHRMAQFPILWDAQSSMFYFGGSSAMACGHAYDLMKEAFEIDMQRVTVGQLARNWAEKNKKLKAIDELNPASFHPAHSGGDATWANVESGLPDFLGNEFLMWLWYTLENETDTLTLADETEVTAMFAKSLVLECPLGDSGRETLSSEIPTKLPEAMEGLRSGKMPRRAGLVLVRFGQQYELTLQAETFAISGAKLQADKEAVGREVLESRIDAIRSLNETVDTLFETFCALRVSKEWNSCLSNIQKWVAPTNSAKKRGAA